MAFKKWIFDIHRQVLLKQSRENSSQIVYNRICAILNLKYLTKIIIFCIINN